MSNYFHEAFEDLLQKKKRNNKDYGRWGIDLYLASLSKDKFLESYNAQKDQVKDMIPYDDKPSPYQV